MKAENLGKAMSIAKGGGGITGIMMILTVSIEELASFIIFECPCNPEKNRLYGLAYLLGPAVMLYLIALGSQQIFWRLFTGAFKRKRSIFTGQSSGSYLTGLKVWVTASLKALPAAIVWVIILLLKGEIYTCALWPQGTCSGNETYVLPCQIPKTVDVDLQTCNAQTARDFKSQSHMIAWIYIIGTGVVLFWSIVLFKACGQFSYYQDMWAKAYRAAEDAAFKRKLNLRANDLACELTNEFLEEERLKDEWDAISRIQKPVLANQKGSADALLQTDKELYNYTPLYQWANKQAKYDSNGANSGFYYLTKDEMTFNKERHPPPVVTQHNLNINLDEKIASILKN